MAFDAQAYRAAHRPWSFTIGVGRSRRTFVARPVSAPQVMRYYDQLTAAAGKDAKALAALRWILRHAFPWRPSYWLTGDPVRLILGLEPGARRAALADFFRALHGAPAPEQTGPATAGTTSPTRTLTTRG